MDNSDQILLEKLENISSACYNLLIKLREAADILRTTPNKNSETQKASIDLDMDRARVMAILNKTNRMEDLLRTVYADRKHIAASTQELAESLQALQDNLM